MNKETLREAAETYSSVQIRDNAEKAFIAGAEWQAEMMSSEKELSAQDFCSKAEGFAFFLKDSNLSSYWVGDKLKYYHEEKSVEDMDAEVVLDMFNNLWGS